MQQFLRCNSKSIRFDIKSNHRFTVINYWLSNVFSVSGEFTIMYLFTRFRFNWDEVKFSFWSTYCIITNLIGKQKR